MIFKVLETLVGMVLVVTGLTVFNIAVNLHSPFLIMTLLIFAGFITGAAGVFLILSTWEV